jgi:hypothetical protein
MLSVISIDKSTWVFKTLEKYHGNNLIYLSSILKELKKRKNEKDQKSINHDHDWTFADLDCFSIY